MSYLRRPRTGSGVAAVGLARLVVGMLMIGVLVYAYALRIRAGEGNPFDYFGYFTNQTTSLTAMVLIAVGAITLSGLRAAAWLTTARGVATAYLLVVGVVYNVLVPGTGSAPPWVSTLLHIVFPIVVALDWVLLGDRPPQRWNKLWVVLPYPLLWLTVVLIRGATDGWVPYGFLLPAHGAVSLSLHVLGLITALLVAGALVWSASRLGGAGLRPIRQ